jgi:hypothetical protein
MALLPVVAVNLVQHLAAGWADARLRRGVGELIGSAPTPITNKS